MGFSVASWAISISDGTGVRRFNGVGVKALRPGISRKMGHIGLLVIDLIILIKDQNGLNGKRAGKMVIIYLEEIS